MNIFIFLTSLFCSPGSIRVSFWLHFDEYAQVMNSKEIIADLLKEGFANDEYNWDVTDVTIKNNRKLIN